MTGTPALRRRPILGMSAVLLPFTADGAVDWHGFESLVARTVAAGLVPAVNMDTGYVQLLDADTRARPAGRRGRVWNSRVRGRRVRGR